jgi:ketosteroid isomerase-like protein
VQNKTQLVDTFDRFRTALLTNDVQVIDAVMADDYIGYDPLGKPQDRKTSVEAYQPGCVRLDRYDVDQLEVRVLGDVGIITGQGYIHGTFAGSEFEHHLRFLDLYVHREGRWQLDMSQVTPMEAT